MEKDKLRKIALNDYMLILYYYLLFYAIYPIGFMFRKFDLASNNKIYLILVFTYLIIVYIFIPLFLLLKAIMCYKNYSLANFINIFIKTFLIAVPLSILFVLGLYALGHYEETFSIFLKSMPIGMIIATFVGLIAIGLNSIYILILRILNKA